ncbi:GNAT family N-acetyltransferase [Nonomuraea gerenzanensis]|uniref:GCN5-related N-acetyltransferase n=1 Tax=Nonomuraea gerenzanensis TaxID=93944 RepID=A0A1M4ELE9_9ACTN|nr:GNAT family N-acetyltransferase [Nonomuraea gerenzanensis]UBU11194.1 GNAT family N-acetyltransferase [Nonomuraea gerenzanensis]SBO99664.1 GCN5-related N-acetyltransferase [Nonomuraea gerenzanensis]
MWTFTSSVEEYAAVAEPFLLGDPVRNTVPLTVLANLRAGMPVKDPRYGWWTVDGEIRGAVFHTPPFPAGLFAVPVEAVAPLLEALDGELPVFVGPLEVTVEATRLLGTPARIVSERLFRLGTLAAPGTPGRGRLAVAADLPLLVSWYQAFGDETGMGEGDIVERVVRRLEGRELFVWEADQAPVSFAGLSPEAGGVCRIGPVYTPPSRRRRGYGAAVTAYASRVALAERCEQVVLFTDLANPTSNAIYQAIGYEPVSDYAHVTYR